MAEENNPQPAATGEGEQPQGPQFGVQRIYLKDCSFESPRSPQVFQGQWQPSINFDINTKSQNVQDDVHEVVLTLTAEAKNEDSSSFLIEVQQAGIFTCKDFDEAQKEHILAAVCPNILYPYAREIVDSLVVKGSFPALMLAPINFDALYQQKKQQAQSGEAGTEPPAPESVQ
ncbi:MAG: protein-export chaperone SecB [Gammaproteobacteria bacterium]|nr:secB [Symbiodinium microadriaticum]